MTAVTCHVRGCTQQVGDGFVCQSCADQLTADLHRVIRGHLAGVVVLEISDERHTVSPTLRRQVTVGRREGEPVLTAQIQPGDYGRVSSSPYDHRGLADDVDVTFTRNMRTSDGGFDERAGRLRVELTRTLVRYAQLVADARSITLPDDAQPFTLAIWLERHVPWLRHQETGAAAVADIASIVTRIKRAIDRPADRWYAGPCTAEPADEPGGYCATDLYAKPDAHTVTCRRCGQRYPLSDRRDWLRTAAEDTLAHAEWIGRAASVFGVDITPSAIRGYAHRGRIAQHSTDQLGRPLYRVGDVIDVAQAIATDRARRKQRKAG